MAETNSKKAEKRGTTEATGRFAWQLPLVSVQAIEGDGVLILFRAAGYPGGTGVLLLHGFPASSFMFRELIPRLADRYRVIAPDLPGFGFTQIPGDRKYEYTFHQLALTID